MDTLIKADIFFFVATLATVLLSCGILFVLVYLIRALQSMEDLANKLADNVDKTGESVKDMVDEVRESFIFSLLFKKKNKKSKGH